MYPWVKLVGASLWPPISGVFVLRARVAGACLFSAFSNFRFGGAETGSTVARDWFEERPLGKITRRDADVGSTASLGSFG
jgi:hypothetical protein